MQTGIFYRDMRKMGPQEQTAFCRCFTQRNKIMRADEVPKQEKAFTTNIDDLSLILRNN